MKEKWNQLMKKVTYAIAAIAPMLLFTPTAFAAGSSDTSDLEWIRGEGNGTFSELTDTVQKTGASLYKLMMAIGVVGLVCIAVYVGLKLAAAGAGKRAEALEQLLWLIVGGSIVFGSYALIGLMRSIGGNL